MSRFNSGEIDLYPVVWLDGFVVKVHQAHQEINKTIYLALAINLNGYKELLGIWIAEHEGAKFASSGFNRTQ